MTKTSKNLLKLNIFSSFTRHIHQSLTSKTLISMGLRIALVVMILTGISYFHLLMTLETGVKEQLEKYVVERGKREEALFKLAEDNHNFLKTEILHELAEKLQENPGKISREFAKLTYKWSDGTIRNAAENIPIKQFDTSRYSTVYLGREVEISNEVKARTLTFYELTTTYGKAWSHRFANTYVNTQENINSIYWPDFPLGLKHKNLYIPAEEFFYISDLKHNPERKTAWTGVYLDPTVKVWMVSVETPVDDINGKHIGTIGNDIVLSSLIENTIKDKLPGTYNILFQADGKLIAHPDFIPEINAGQGQSNLNQIEAPNTITINNPHLQRIFNLSKQIKSGKNIIDDPIDKEFLAVTKLTGPDWYFVTVYPQRLLNQLALENAKFILFVGILALIIELFLLFLVLKNRISQPLRQLLTATEAITAGDFTIHLDNNRQDEIGRIATSFNSMTSKLQESFQLLENSNSQLEVKVQERTESLSQALQELQQAQMQLVQNEKMSSLGQLVAGIAHEINNPISFIHGNLQYAQEYMNDLIDVIYLYQQEYQNPSPTLLKKMAEVEIDFITDDLEKIFRSMENGTTRVREIVKSLRSFSRLDEANIKTINIHDAIDSTLMVLQHKLGGIEIIKNYQELSPIECYAGELNQVFLNILTNAIDAVLENNMGVKYQPTIQICTKLVNSEHHPNQEQIQISFIDNGVGIPEDILPKIFDPFFTTKPVGQGTGMGISICYQVIAEKHNGKLEYFSKVGEGTEVLIQIPTRLNATITN